MFALCAIRGRPKGEDKLRPYAGFKGEDKLRPYAGFKGEDELRPY